MEVNFKIFSQGKIQIFPFEFDCRYHYDVLCNNDIPNINGLATLFKIDIAWHGLVQKWSSSQCWHTYFMTTTYSNLWKWHLRRQWNDVWSAISWVEVCRLCGVGLVPKDYFHWLQGWKWTFNKGRSQWCSGGNSQYVKSCGFTTVWLPLIWLL